MAASLIGLRKTYPVGLLFPRERAIPNQITYEKVALERVQNSQRGLGLALTHRE